MAGNLRSPYNDSSLFNVDESSGTSYAPDISNKPTRGERPLTPEEKAAQAAQLDALQKKLEANKAAGSLSTPPPTSEDARPPATDTSLKAALDENDRLKKALATGPGQREITDPELSESAATAGRYLRGAAPAKMEQDELAARESLASRVSNPSSMKFTAYDPKSDIAAENAAKEAAHHAYAAEKQSNQWKELATMVGQGLAQYGAGKEGAAKGLAVAPLEFGKGIDYDARTKQAYAEYVDELHRNQKIREAQEKSGSEAAHRNYTAAREDSDTALKTLLGQIDTLAKARGEGDVVRERQANTAAQNYSTAERAVTGRENARENAANRRDYNTERLGAAAATTAEHARAANIKSYEEGIKEDMKTLNTKGAISNNDSLMVKSFRDANADHPDLIKAMEDTASANTTFGFPNDSDRARALVQIKMGAKEKALDALRSGGGGAQSPAGNPTTPSERPVGAEITKGGKTYRKVKSGPDGDGTNWKAI